MSDKNLKSVDLDRVALKGYTNYANAVILGRALPDVRDGLKPVQRRILYAMYNDLGLRSDSKYRKSASTVGRVLGSYHPHGDQACYMAMVRMAQPFSMSETLVDGYGNFGSVDGDEPAALRYTEARLTPSSENLLVELKDNVVDYIANFDGTTKEPVVLPAKYPNLLVNGAIGIAVGIATSIPPHNLKEACQSVIHILDNRNSDIHIQDILKILKCPDFPTGGIVISSKKEVQEVYETGSGPIEIRSTYHVEDLSYGIQNLIFTSIPYGSNKSKILDSIGSLINDNSLPQARDVRDESTTDIRIVIELKKGADPDNVAAYILNKTELQSRFNVNFVTLMPTEDGNLTPKRIGLLEYLYSFIDFRYECVKNKLVNELENIKSKIHLFKGYSKLVSDIDKAIDIVRNSKNRKYALEQLKEHFEIDDLQANSILETKIYKLNKDEIDKFISQISDLKFRKKEIESALSDDDQILDIVKSDLEQIISNSQSRRTKYSPRAKGTLEFDEKSFVIDEDCNVFLTSFGYIKRQKSSTNSRLKDGDDIVFQDEFNTRDNIAILTSTGKCYTTVVADIVSTIGYGDPISTMFSFSDGEKIIGALPIRFEQENSGYIQTITELGYVSKIDISYLKDQSTKKGRKFINLSNSDTIIRVDVIQDADDEIDPCIISIQSRVLRTKLDDVDIKDKPLKGNKIISLSNDDRIIEVIDFNQVSDFELEFEDDSVKKITNKTNYSNRGSKGKLASRKYKVKNIKVN